MSESSAAAPPVAQPPAVGPLPAAFAPLLAAERLPAWLPPVLAVLYRGYAATDGYVDVAGSCGAGFDPASRWAHRLAALLHELGSPLPFAVVHDWQARTVVPMMAAAAGPPGVEAATAGLRQLHARAAAGEQVGEADWRAALEPALQELYRHAYGYAEAYASAHASASAYARANDFSEQGAVSFAESYAATSTDANRDSFAGSNAFANAAVLAQAYASGDPRAYAEAYPFALVQACAHAWANAAGRCEPASPAPADAEPRTPARLRQLAYARLADGLADSCAARLG